MERRRLTAEEINEGLRALDGWEERNGRLVRRFKFPDFAASLAFVNRIGEIADAADHHPDIKFGWGYADVELTTHDRGGVTDLDFELARQIDSID